MPASQLILEIKTTAPEVSQAEVEAFCAWLKGKSWITARQITEEFGYDDRWVRLVAQHSDGRILSGPGCPGYRYFDADALPFAERAILATRSQIAHMTKRLVAYQRRYHSFAKDQQPA
ncbi:MAG: hypothetical protein WC378_05325 [Opitutaceae bacterium]|jgi:hypothetical protein